MEDFFCQDRLFRLQESIIIPVSLITSNLKSLNPLGGPIISRFSCIPLNFEMRLRKKVLKKIWILIESITTKTTDKE